MENLYILHARKLYCAKGKINQIQTNIIIKNFIELFKNSS